MKELAAALAKAQAKMKPAKRSTENPFFKSTYADLADVWAACQVPLTENGLSVSQTTDFDEHGVWIKTVLMHTSGESIEGRFPVRPLKPDPQALGSAISYGRRYSLAAIVGVVTEDDDGNEGSKKDEHKANGHHEAPASRKNESDDIRKAREWTNEQMSVLLKMKVPDDYEIWLDRWSPTIMGIKRKVPDEFEALSKAMERAKLRLNQLAGRLMSAIAATFSDFKLIRGRKVAQLVFEVPLEGAQEALKILGMPGGDEIWCALARLKSEPKKNLGDASTREDEGTTVKASALPSGCLQRNVNSPAKPKQKWSELKPSAQAAIRCEDLDFATYLQQRGDLVDRSPKEAVRAICIVHSRADLDTNSAAARRWYALDIRFQDWLGQQRVQQQHEAYAR